MLYNIDHHSAEVFDHEMPLPPFLGSYLKENGNFALLELFVFLIDVVDFKGVDGFATPTLLTLAAGFRLATNF